MAAKALSGKQKQIITFIRQYLRDNGISPSIRDIAKGCNISSTSVVTYNLNKLEQAGHIRRRSDISRGIELLDNLKRDRKLIYIPIIGEIAAGKPIPVPDSRAATTVERLPVSEGLIREKGNIYAVRVKGNSMVDALIGEGDIVLLDYVDSVEDGDMVAVWLKKEQEVTLKKLFKQGDNTVRLESANSQVSPLRTTADNINIQGKVVAVIRRMT